MLTLMLMLIVLLLLMLMLMLLSLVRIADSRSKSPRAVPPFDFLAAFTRILTQPLFLWDFNPLHVIGPIKHFAHRWRSCLLVSLRCATVSMIWFRWSQA